MSNDPLSNREILSVSDLTRSARRLLEGEFPMVFVEGEISNFTRPSSGHWYLTLKDDKAQLRCAMFVNRNRLVRFAPKDGMQILVRGRISIYEGRGEFQLIAEHMEESGDGALRRAFDQLKAKLDAEGLFERETKREIPRVPAHIAVITSISGAAIRDVLHVLERRFPAIPVSVIPVSVQGEGASEQIVAAIDFANRYEKDPFDVILLTRGGGSLEDLWSFNTEPVARAIFDSEIPIVCGVGHETDVTIADFVADLRAPTPSVAAEMLSPDASEWLGSFTRHERTFTQYMTNRFTQDARHLENVARRLRHPGRHIADLHQRIDDLEMRQLRALTQYLGSFRLEDVESRLVRAIRHKLDYLKSKLDGQRLRSPGHEVTAASGRVLEQYRRLKKAIDDQIRNTGRRLDSLESNLTAVSPTAVLERGYAIVLNADGSVLRNADDTAPGETVTARLKRGSISAEVKDTDTSDGDSDT